MAAGFRFVVLAWQFWATAALFAEDKAPPVLTVAADGSAKFVSVQAAIDAAPDFAVIRIAKGTYDGPLTITRPVTLEGAGWQDTHVRGQWFDVYGLIQNGQGLSPEAKQRLDALVRRLKNADGKDEGKLHGELWTEFGPKPVLSVVGASKVILKGLRFSYLGAVHDGGWAGAPMIRFENSTVRVESCALVGSAVEGLNVKNAADVQIRDSLVAGIRASGIVVNTPVTSRVLVQNCEIHHCGYAGVQIKGEGDVHVDRCRLASVDFHAVRYDDASPKLTGNVFADINRGGIYADGETRAEIRDNLFLGCSYSGRAGCHDVLEHNTFVYVRPHKNAAWSGETALWIGDATTVRNNVLARYERGVTVFGPALPVMQGNVFDTTGPVFARAISKDEKRSAYQSPPPPTFETLALPAGNQQAKVRFVDEAKDDFALDPAVIEDGQPVGARKVRPVASTWPEVAEERELMQRVARAAAK